MKLRGLMGVALEPSNTLTHRRTTVVQCGIAKRLMSALGQKQTSRPEISMSALLPKADIGGVSSDVRFVPKAEFKSVHQLAYLHALPELRAPQLQSPLRP
jgi:hypothetical protein